MKVIEYDTSKHHIRCSNCGAMLEFGNDDVLYDEMGCCIVCPECKRDIKF